jgi:hypothetical protein
VFVVFLVLVLFVSITVITLPLRINIHGTDMNIHLTILLGFFFHAVGVYVLSLVASFDHLDERLLSPTIGIFMLAFINGLRHVLEDLRGKILLLTTVILLCLTYPSLFQLESPLDRQESNFISIGYPVEMFLWEELDKMEAIQSSTVFFTDIFSHQLFTDIPQKLLINHESGITRLQNPEDVRALLEIGQNPFFLFVSGSEADRYLSNTYQQVGLRRIEFPHLGFVLYSSPG